MQNRLRYLQGAAALLYFGPLLAGLGGFGWGVVPVFLVLFLLWLFILRPHHWPRNVAGWRRPDAVLTLGSHSILQLLLVTLLFGIGRGIGGTLGFLPMYSVVLPISISFLSIPLARMLWDPWKSSDLDQFLDLAIQNADPAETPDAIVGLDLARGMIAPLADLPDTITPAEVGRHLAALSAHADPAHIRTALLERQRTGKAAAAETLALVLHATDPDAMEDVGGDGPTLTLAVLPANADIIALFARRLSQTLSEFPELWEQCPSADLLAGLVVTYNNTDAEGPLRDLITATNAAAPAGDPV